MKIADLILGRRVKADHPVTCLNPEETFIVTEVNFDAHSINGPSFYVKGENTMWFAEGLVELEDLPKKHEKNWFRQLRMEKVEADDIDGLEMTEGTAGYVDSYPGGR
jgi:hypothetical protein